MTKLYSAISYDIFSICILKIVYIFIRGIRNLVVTLKL